MSQNTTSVKAGTGGVARRTLAKGAAWAVPAVVAAGAAPLVAASDGYVTITANSSACKLPGASCDVTKGYTQPFLVCTTVKLPVDVTMAAGNQLTINNETLTVTDYFWVDGAGNVTHSFTFSLPAAGDTGAYCSTFYVRLQLESSANANLIGTLDYSWASTTVGTPVTGASSAEINTPYTPPCKDCTPPASVTWQASHAYTAGDVVQVWDTGSNSWLIFEVTVAGTSGTDQPAWTSAPNINDTVTDGTVTWKHIDTVPAA